MTTKKPGRFLHIVLTPGERSAFLDQLETYLTAMYPGCGPRWRRKLIERARQKGHFGHLGEIAGILVHTLIRHEMTDYDRLMRINAKGRGLARDEARMIVAGEVDTLTTAWRRGSAEDDPSYVALRLGLVQRRQKRGLRRDDPSVMRSENTVVAFFLRRWLEDRLGSAEHAKGAATDHATAPL